MIDSLESSSPTVQTPDNPVELGCAELGAIAVCSTGHTASHGAIDLRQAFKLLKVFKIKQPSPEFNLALLVLEAGVLAIEFGEARQWYSQRKNSEHTLWQQLKNANNGMLSVVAFSAVGHAVVHGRSIALVFGNSKGVLYGAIPATIATSLIQSVAVEGHEYAEHYQQLWPTIKENKALALSLGSGSVIVSMLVGLDLYELIPAKGYLKILSIGLGALLSGCTLVEDFCLYMNDVLELNQDRKFNTLALMKQHPIAALFALISASFGGVVVSSTLLQLRETLGFISAPDVRTLIAFALPGLIRSSQTFRLSLKHLASLSQARTSTAQTPLLPTSASTTTVDGQTQESRFTKGCKIAAKTCANFMLAVTVDCATEIICQSAGLVDEAQMVVRAGVVATSAVLGSQLLKLTQHSLCSGTVAWLTGSASAFFVSQAINNDDAAALTSCATTMTVTGASSWLGRYF